MAESEELRELLHAYLAELSTSDVAANGQWLVDQINTEIHRAEDEADFDWLASHVDDNAEGEHVLSDAARLEIALRVTYHHLVAVPRMWAYVQRFWRAHGQVTVRLIDTTTNEQFEAPNLFTDDSTRAAFHFISRFVDLLDERYELGIRHHGWFPG